jgi:hypothetical protein
VVNELFYCLGKTTLVRVAAWFKVYVCGRLIAGNAGSNSAGDMDVCVSFLLCDV